MNPETELGKARRKRQRAKQEELMERTDMTMVDNAKTRAGIKRLNYEQKIKKSAFDLGIQIGAFSGGFFGLIAGVLITWTFLSW